MERAAGHIPSRRAATAAGVFRFLKGAGWRVMRPCPMVMASAQAHMPADPSQGSVVAKPPCGLHFRAP